MSGRTGRTLFTEQTGAGELPISFTWHDQLTAKWGPSQVPGPGSQWPCCRESGIGRENGGCAGRKRGTLQLSSC